MMGFSLRVSSCPTSDTFTILIYGDDYTGSKLAILLADLKHSPQVSTSLGQDIG